MPEYTVTLPQLPKAWLREIGANKAAVMAGLSVTANTAQQILAEASPTDQGLFKDSWHVYPINNGFDVLNDAPYAEWVENGSRPHWPPPEPIRQWLLRKIKMIGKERLAEGMGAPLVTKTGRARNVHRRKGVIVASDERVINQLTYLICRKISKEGTPAHHVLKNNQVKILALMKMNVEKALEMRG